MTLTDLLATRYVPQGRTMPELDCWGLARLARAHLFGKALLPSFVEIAPANKRGLTRAAQGVTLADSDARPGAIATAWRGAVCVHVGVVVRVDGRRFVLETDEQSGPVLTPVHMFEQRFTRVAYRD